MSDAHIAKQDGAPAIGESLRMLSVVTSIGSDALSLRRLIGVVRQHKPGVAHTFQPPVLRSYGRVFGSDFGQKIDKILNALTRAWLALLSKRRAKIQAELANANPQRAHGLPQGLPLAKFEKIAPPALDRKELVVAWFGRLVAVKNVPLLIEVVEQSLQAVPEIRFVIVGDGAERAAVKGLVERSAGRVESLSWQREPAATIGRADVLMQTSLDEGTPTALIQGMAGARPFVSTAVGSVAELMTGEERIEGKVRWFANGALVPHEADAFVCALQAFAQDRALLPQMGIAGRQWAIANLAESKTPEAKHQFYSECLATQGHHLPPQLPPKMADEFGMTRQLTQLADKTGSLEESEPEER